MDLDLRRIVDLSMKVILVREIDLGALLMPDWRRKSEHDGIIHLDQGSQVSTDGWNRFCLKEGLLPSTNPRGN